GVAGGGVRASRSQPLRRAAAGDRRAKGRAAGEGRTGAAGLGRGGTGSAPQGAPGEGPAGTPASPGNNLKGSVNEIVWFLDASGWVSLTSAHGSEAAHSICWGDLSRHESGGPAGGDL